MQGGHFNGGGPDPWGVLFVVPYGNDGRVTIADTVPATAFANYWRARQDEQFTFRVPPGYQVWFLSNDGTVRGGSPRPSIRTCPDKNSTVTPMGCPSDNTSPHEPDHWVPRSKVYMQPWGTILPWRRNAASAYRQ